MSTREKKLAPSLAAKQTLGLIPVMERASGIGQAHNYFQNCQFPVIVKGEFSLVFSLMQGLTNFLFKDQVANILDFVGQSLL